MACSWLVMALVCLPIALFRLATDGDPRVGQAAMIMVVLCGLLSWRAVRVLGGHDAVNLTSEALEGPTLHFGPWIFGARSKIALGDLAHVRQVGWSVWCAEGWAGQRLYWTDTYEGHDELVNLLGFASRMSER